jgi:RNA polymerase sigma-70 factor (ECF subfamily)
MAYSEREIVEGCVKNERKFQELLYRQHFPKMVSMCLRYTDDNIRAMEITNNGFLRVFQKLHTFAFAGSLEGWIRKIVWHSIAEYFRRSDNNRLAFLPIEDHAHPIDNDLFIHINSDSEMILRLIDKLPPATAEVFKLYGIEGYSHAEIAEKLSISEGTSKWHLSKAREILRNLYEKSKFI